MNKLKLNRLSDQKLAEKQMNMVMGGADSQCPNSGGGCCCGCPYQGQPGGSDTWDNMNANSKGNLYTKSVCKPNPST